MGYDDSKPGAVKRDEEWSHIMMQRSRALRKRQTVAERHLWSLLRRRQCEGWRFRRQRVIGDRYIADFYCPEARLVIEVDGRIHAKRKEYDEAHTKWIEGQDIRVVRFSNREVLNEPGEVLKVIREMIEGEQGRSNRAFISTRSLALTGAAKAP